MQLYIDFSLGHLDSMHGTFIGFSAEKMLDQYYVNGDVITFETPLLNENGDYIPELSRFLCPTSGIYYVTVNIYTGVDGHGISVEKNGLGILYSTEYDRDNNYFNTFSNSRLFECEEGQFISVKGTRDGFVQPTWTTFSSMMLIDRSSELS